MHVDGVFSVPSILTYKADSRPSFSDDTGVCGLLSVSSFIMRKNLCSFELDYLLLESGSGFLCAFENDKKY